MSFATHKLSLKVFRESLLDTEEKFYIAAIYIFLNMIFASSLTYSLDSLPVIFMSYAVAMLRDLSKRLEKIGKEIKRPGKVVITQERLLMKELIACVKVHLKIKKFIRNIEKLFSTIIMVQGLLITIIICTSIYVLPLVIYSTFLSFELKSLHALSECHCYFHAPK